MRTTGYLYKSSSSVLDPIALGYFVQMMSKNTLLKTFPFADDTSTFFRLQIHCLKLEVNHEVEKWTLRWSTTGFPSNYKR